MGLQVQHRLQSLVLQVPLSHGAAPQPALMGEPAGISHLVPAITPRAWPCLHLKVQQEALI